MKRLFEIAILCVILWLVAVPAAMADYEYIDITNPFLKKIPLAIPQFKVYSADAAATEAFGNAARILSQSLDFTGYFKILDPAAYLYDPADPPVIGPNIDFANWTGIGAELMITGSMLTREGVVEVELRLFDTFKEKLIVGKKYTAQVGDLKKIIRRFCSEVLLALTGSSGYFDTQIAFVSTGTGNKEIYTCDFDGADARQLTHNNAITLFPAWSSDRQWIAYTAYTRGRPDLYIKNLTQPQGYVVAEKGINVKPAWVPGRFELAATLSFSGDQEIYLLTGTGKIIKRLTHTGGIDVHPAWSPDGNKMAFVSDRAGTPQIFIMEMDSGQVRRLTYDGRYNTQPSWSPRGDKIAYSAMDDNQLNIRVIGVDGQGGMQLTREAGDNEGPSWSPDGSLIAFSSTREGPSRIYVMTAFGTDQRQLLALPGQQSDPEWSPSSMKSKALSGF
ncbi:MAG: Tol-Pal system beta propeller repeat protein TolB [Pseudomonadota bacterium]